MGWISSLPDPLSSLSFVHGETMSQVNCSHLSLCLGSFFGESIDKPITSGKSQGKEVTLLPCSPPASSPNDPSGSLSSPISHPCYLGPSLLCPPNAKLGENCPSQCQVLIAAQGTDLRQPGNWDRASSFQLLCSSLCPLFIRTGWNYHLEAPKGG